MTYFLTPASVDTQHIANQKLSITHTVSPTHTCAGHRCDGRLRSIAQFNDKFGNPTRKLCKLCRGVK